MKKQTKAIRIQTPKSQFREHSTPIYLTSSFCFDDAQMGLELFDKSLEGNIYSRFSNPTVQEFIDKVCMLEGAESGVATATGMAAVFAALSAHLKTGDHIVASRALFGSTYQILTQIFPNWGIECTFVDAEAQEKDWENAIKKNTKVIFVETPSNPGLQIVDLSIIAKIAKKNNLISIVDNCFASPILQLPIKYGIDIVLHSATKFMDGQGRVLGGVIVGDENNIEPIRFFCRQTGGSMSPFNAWVLSKSLETLKLRMDKHCENAGILAEAFAQDKNIKNVMYPYLKSHPQYELAKSQMSAGGAIIAIELDGGFERINKFTQFLKIPSLTSNLGDSRTTITNPFSTTHHSVDAELKKKLNITEGLLRISVGLEDPTDLIEDISQAIKQSKS